MHCYILINNLDRMENYQSSSMTTINDLVQLELFVSARGLCDMDVFSKSDPYVKVFFKSGPGNQWTFIGRTETVDNNLNPNFKKSFVVDYIFQARQELKFEVMDEDDKKNSNNDDFIGKVETTLGALAGARDQTSILQLVHPQKKQGAGKLILRVEPCNQQKQFLTMKWKAVQLINTDSWFDWWDKSDPYLKFLKIRKDNTFVEVTRTAVVMNDLNPKWDPVQLSISKLMREDNLERKFKVECWDWEEESEAKHQFIGQAYIRLPQLLQAETPLQIPLTNPKCKKPGKLILQRFNLYQKPSFIDYLRGGLQLNLSVAIDFTGSNGVSTQPTSLHYINSYSPNQYQQAIMAIGNILINYDYDKRIPAFGFGAVTKFPTMNSTAVSHCFPLSGNYGEIQAEGLDGLMNFYCRALTNVSFSGPTYFAPIIRQFVDIAYKAHMEAGGSTYQVLLILTDGEIHDMDQTVNLIVANCHLPLSIIIVGVGKASFENMNTLDGDNGLYNSTGLKAARDIVQFVPFSQVQLNPQLLAKQLLAELPLQVTQIQGMIGKKPNPAKEVQIENILMDTQAAKIEANLKQNLPQLFAGLALNPTVTQSP